MEDVWTRQQSTPLLLSSRSPDYCFVRLNGCELKRILAFICVLSASAFALLNQFTRVDEGNVLLSSSVPASSIPIPMDMTYMRPDRKISPEAAVALLSSMLVDKNVARNHDGQYLFKTSAAPKLFMNSQKVRIGGKEYLKTTLLDAVLDYKESAQANALVNQVFQQKAMK
jgi:hypothetical protein